MRSWTASVTRRGRWVAIDAVAIAAASLGGIYLSAHLNHVPFDVRFTLPKYAFIVFGISCSLIASGALYIKAFRRWQTYRQDLTSLAAGSGLAALSLLAVFAVLPGKPIQFALSDAFWPTAVSLVTLALVRAVEFALLHRSYRGTTVVFVEPDPRWAATLHEVRAVLETDWHLAVATVDEATRNAFADVDGVELWGRDHLEKWIANQAEPGRKQLFVLDQRLPSGDLHARMVKKSYRDRVVMTNMIDFHEEILEKTPLFEHDDYWYTSIGLGRPHPLHLFVKRAMDLLIAVPLFLASLPLTVVLGLYIRRESEGPAIFQQIRVGQYGREFTVYKLRTMGVHADDSAQWPHFAVSKVTRSGAILRKTGIDELPQLFNVIKGDMSLIGPRPARPMVTERHIDRNPFYAVVYSVKPGISGWSQLHQGQDAGDHTMFEKARYNLYYAKFFSMRLDLLIYIRTFSQLISGRKRNSVYLAEHSNKAGSGDALQQSAGSLTESPSNVTQLRAQRR